jgi:putative toxin-antitoxin system antitoxin component (TIGR02293 family)
VTIYALSVMERADIVEHGVPARFLERLAVELAVSKEKLYHIIGVSRATADRKLKADQVLSAADSEHVIGMARLVGQVQQIVQESGDPAGFDAGRWVTAFLDAPSPALGGRRPRDLMRTSEPPGRTSMQWGTDWLTRAESLPAEVPSIVVPEETNILINPAHSDIAAVTARTVRKWTYDRRFRAVD